LRKSNRRGSPPNAGEIVGDSGTGGAIVDPDERAVAGRIAAIHEHHRDA
jgi:hypothetical protein